MAHREYDDDDGRTIADMSGVSRPSLFGNLPRSRAPKPQPQEDEKTPFTPKERRMFALGAMKAALLIGLAYIVGLAAVVGLLLLLWSIF